MTLFFALVNEYSKVLVFCGVSDAPDQCLDVASDYWISLICLHLLYFIAQLG